MFVQKSNRIYMLFNRPTLEIVFRQRKYQILQVLI